MKTYLMGTLLAGWLGVAQPATGQTTRLDWAWTAAMGRQPSSSNPVVGDAFGNHVLATADGGGLVSGFYDDHLALGTNRGDTLRSAYAEAGLLVKYNAAGQRQWARSIQGAGEMDCRWANEDSQGNLYCVVRHDSPLSNPGGVPLLPGAAWYRYSATGTFLQAGDLAIRGQLYASSFDRDAVGNLTVSGSVTGPSTIGGTAVGRLGGYGDSFVTKLGPNAVPLWVRQLVSTGPSNGNAVFGQAVLPNGDVLVGGSFGGNVRLDLSTTLASTGRLGFLACYNGSTGAMRWGRAIPVPVFPIVDPTSGQAYVAGEFIGSLFLNGLVFTALARNLFIARLDATTGAAQTAVFSGGGPYDQTLQRISCQPGGAFTLSGFGEGGVDFGVDLGILAATPTASAYYILQINAAGMGQALYPIPVMAWSLAVGPGGNPYVLANPSSAVRFGRLPVVVPKGNYEIILAHVGLVLGTRNNTPLTGLSAYPNPSRRQEMITITGPWPTAQVQVSDLLGRQMWTGALENGRVMLPTATFQPGLYMMQATDGFRTAAKKLLIE